MVCKVEIVGTRTRESLARRTKGAMEETDHLRMDGGFELGRGRVREQRLM